MDSVRYIAGRRARPDVLSSGLFADKENSESVLNQVASNKSDEPNALSVKPLPSGEVNSHSHSSIEHVKKTYSPAPRGHFKSSSRSRGSQRGSKGFGDLATMLPQQPTARNLFSQPAASQPAGSSEILTPSKASLSQSPLFLRASSRLFTEGSSPLAETPFKFKVTVGPKKRELVAEENLLNSLASNSSEKLDYIPIDHKPSEPVAAPVAETKRPVPVAHETLSRKRFEAPVQESPAKRRRISLGTKSTRKQIITNLPTLNLGTIGPAATRNLPTAESIFSECSTDAPCRSPTCATCATSSNLGSRSRSNSTNQAPIESVPSTPNHNGISAPELSSALNTNLTVPDSIDCDTPMNMNEILAWVIFGQDDFTVTKAFVLSYIHFKLTAKDLFKLVWTFYHQPPLQYWKLVSTFAQQRARVVNFVSTWIQVSSGDFDLSPPPPQTPGVPLPKEKANKVPLKFYLRFLDVLKTDGLSSDLDLSSSPANCPQTPVRTPREGRESTGGTAKRSSLFSSSRRSSSSKLVRNSFSQFDAYEFATQLTAYEFKLLKAVPLSELVGQAWNKAEKETNAPRVTNIINHFNRMSYWVGQEICSGETSKEQSKKIDKFISVGKRLKDLGNFNGLMEVFSGLMSNPVQRLTDAWKSVSNKQMARLKKMEALLSPYQNAGAYRTRLATCQRSPVIPYIGVHLGDIVHLIEGIEDTVPDKYELHKVIQMGKMLSDWHRWQKQSCEIEEDQNIIQFLLTLKGTISLNGSLN